MAELSEKNYYKILGIEKNASLEEIKKRYRELAKRHHPDTNNGSKKAENNFKILSNAYSILSDKKKRDQYDRQRASRARSQKRSARYSWADFGQDFEYREQRRSHQDNYRSHATPEEPAYDPEMPTRGFDLQFMINLPLKTVALGGKVPYTYDKYVQCSGCAGTGRHGSEECGECKGKRLSVKTVTLKVSIPPGVADQYTLRIPNEGGEGKNGGPPGDLLLKVCTLPHPGFKRIKNDIFAECNISSELAERGGFLEVNTLNSIKTIQIEEGTLTGEEFRIPGEGAAIQWGKKRGDFIVKFSVVDD